MPGSTDAPTIPSRIKAKNEFLAKIESGQISSVPAKARTEIHELPRWVKTALVYHEVDGLSWEEAAARLGRSGGTLSEYGRSLAAEKWLSGLKEFLADPVAMAKAYLAANALSITLERFAFLEAAVAAGDYKAGDAIARDLQDRIGIIAKKADSGAISVKVQLIGGGGSPIVEGEWEEVTPDV